MTKWRPEKWKPRIRLTPAYPGSAFEDIFEQGADAMLEVLRKEGLGNHGLYRGCWTHCTDPTHWQVCDAGGGTFPLETGVKGTLVFIPDDKEDK